MLRFHAVVALVVLVGCNRGPARVAAPDWDPDDFADAIMTKLDANSDGALEQAEFASAPGLAWGAKYIDTDQDGSLSREELLARFAMYEKMRLGLTSKSIQLVYGQRPLGGVKVRFVPEFFLEGVVEPATGETLPDGIVNPQTEGMELPGMRVGYYRVVVESPKTKIPAKYGAADTTPLGVEVSPISEDPATYGTIQLVLDRE